jgi:alkylation response protein AidB-like acyl-CoA dehydrogenase
MLAASWGAVRLQGGFWALRVWPEGKSALYLSGTEMQVFIRDLIDKHCFGAAWPELLGGAKLGARFVVETERFNRADGPVAVPGIRAGDDTAVVGVLPKSIFPFDGEQ